MYSKSHGKLGHWYRTRSALISGILTFVLIAISDYGLAQSESALELDKAEWRSRSSELRIEGEGTNGETVTISNADTAAVIDTVAVDDGRWLLSLINPPSVPCRVRAEQSDGQSIIEDVEQAPTDCDDGNSSGDNSAGNGGFTVVAANDLGMHCADLDYQIFSILPPFNVVHAQVVQHGTASSPPRILDDNSVEVTYHATSNPNDPAGGSSINTTSQNAGGNFKTNFWDDSGHPIPLSSSNQNNSWGGRAYSPLYPSVLAGALLSPPQDLSGECADPATQANCPSILNLFEPMPADLGIPVPDPNALFPQTGTPVLTVDQQHMPGSSNTPQKFDRFDVDLPFFVDFPFGSRIRGINWFAADGIPIMPVDDSGRPNAYPLMQIAAHDRNTGNQLASLDVVLPVASEADCQNCHVESLDCNDPGLPSDIRSNDCIGAAVVQTPFDVMTLDDNPPGETRVEQLLNTAKINILRLHDVKHGSNYQNWNGDKLLVSMACDPAADPSDPDCLANQTPIQCSRCHYSPALDLAQAGPVNEPEQGLLGRQQLNHISMSRAMHGHHGQLPPFEGHALFPDLPRADDPQRRSGATAVNDFEQDILERSCYQCHPGKRTQCLRGAMFAGGVLCQDCHGNMAQVGDDFSGDLPNNPGKLNLSKRVPWAHEPGCQSCHTGDASNPNHPTGAIVAEDGIRLAQAYVSSNSAATPIQAPNSRFAENENLYRLSKGHGGIMCEGCHNSTHAIWPIQNPFANDNVASNQLQGHSGTLTECSTCHADGSLGLTLEGPHGMHPVNDPAWTDGHEEIAEDDLDSCRSCHGNNGQGTVLSRMSDTRTLECEDTDLADCNDNHQITLSKGTQVSCNLCHENEL